MKMNVDWIKILIRRPECIARNLLCIHRQMNNKDIYDLWTLAKNKADYIERHSNYHSVDTTVHLRNEALLRKLFEQRIHDNIRDHF